MLMIQQFLQAIHEVDDAAMEEYVSCWKPISFPKRTIMTAEGDVEKYMYFVQEGIQKSYYLNEGKQHVIAFTYAPSFSGIPESFLRQQPSLYFLETVSDSVFLRIPYAVHCEMMQKHRSIETLFRIATEEVLIGLIHRHYELLAFDIRYRFTLFARRSPHLLNMVPHKDLASYLGMDATNFSKLLGSIKI